MDEIAAPPEHIRGRLTRGHTARETRAAWIRECRAAGHTMQAIADILGVCVTTVFKDCLKTDRSKTGRPRMYGVHMGSMGGISHVPPYLTQHALNTRTTLAEALMNMLAENLECAPPPNEIRGSMLVTRPPAQLAARKAWVLDQRANGRTYINIAKALGISVSAAHAITGDLAGKPKLGTLGLPWKNATPRVRRVVMEYAAAKGLTIAEAALEILDFTITPPGDEELAKVTKAADALKAAINSYRHVHTAGW